MNKLGAIPGNVLAIVPAIAGWPQEAVAATSGGSEMGDRSNWVAQVAVPEPAVPKTDLQTRDF